MLRGHFNRRTGRPYLEGRLRLPRLGIEGVVQFLVDTGADDSLLSPGDASAAGVDFSALRSRSTALGLGGAVECYVEPATIAFVGDDDIRYSYNMELEIAAMQPETMGLPSILGREVIDRWRMVYDPTMDVLEFEVRSADLTIGPED